MSAQFPRIAAGLVTAFPLLPGWAESAPGAGDAIIVIDGPMTAGLVPPRYATVGFTSEGQSGSYATAQADDGFRIAETGMVHCELVAGTGSVAAAQVRDVVQDALDALDDWVRADRRLGGLLSAEGTSSFTVTTTPLLRDGTAFVARFALTYTTVT